MRTLKKVVISLSGHDHDLRYHEDILLNLPDYTDIVLLVPRSNVAVISQLLENRPYRDQVQLVHFDCSLAPGAFLYYLFPEEEKLKRLDADESVSVYQQGTMWAQDLFEVGVTDLGQPILLVPEVHKFYSSYVVGTMAEPNEFLVTRDTAFIQNLSSPILETKLLPFAFKGGNLLTDRWQGRNLVFCGGDLLRTTRTIWRATTDEDASDSAITKALGERLNADDVFVLGQGRLQPNLLYHLDQAMVLLPDGIAGVERIVDSPPVIGVDAREEIKQVKQFLAETRVLLKILGYQVFDIEVTEANVHALQHYANSIPYHDWRTGARKIMMPLYPECDTRLDREIVSHNTAVLESFGYEVRQIPSTVDALRGGIHCLLNVVE